MCDTCMSPGACCREIVLGGGTAYREIDDPAEIEAMLARGDMDQDGQRKYAGAIMPFKVKRRHEDGSWIFMCPKLDTATGRCTIYEQRPFCCSDYKPGSDPLCVHYWREDDAS
jgi:Fe-S-cluster containining protein